MEKSNFSAKDIREACRKFDPLWDTLSNKEQWRMLKTLLESVEFDAATESININFAPGGVKKLTGQQAQLQETSQSLQEAAQ